MSESSSAVPSSAEPSAWGPLAPFDGLVPVVVQDADSGAVLTLAYANQEALERTLATGQSHFFSRSRQQLWHKGETSGHFQDVVGVVWDCDRDALLYRVRPQGPACHTGETTCFHRAADAPSTTRPSPGQTPVGPEVAGLATGHGAEPTGAGRWPLGQALARVADVVAQRHRERPEGSYSTYLFAQGIDKIGKKIGEEATETVIALKNADPEAIAAEAADLLFHLLVALEASGVHPDEVAATLQARLGQPSRLPGKGRPEA